jgi:hypothetical protein
MEFEPRYGISELLSRVVWLLVDSLRTVKKSGIGRGEGRGGEGRGGEGRRGEERRGEERRGEERRGEERRGEERRGEERGHVKCFLFLSNLLIWMKSTVLAVTGRLLPSLIT